MSEPTAFHLVGRSYRHTDVIARNVDSVLAQYMDEKFEWDIFIAPMMTPEGPNIGLGFLMTAPLPLLGADGRFMVQGQVPNLMTFHDIANVRQIVHDFVEQLRKQRVEAALPQLHSACTTHAGCASVAGGKACAQPPGCSATQFYAPSHAPVPRAARP